MRTKKPKQFKNTPKEKLMERLCNVRKGMPVVIVQKWQEWAAKKYPKYATRYKELTTVMFNSMVRGERLGDWHFDFAVEVAKEGERLMAEHNKELQKKVNSI